MGYPEASFSPSVEKTAEVIDFSKAQEAAGRKNWIEDIVQSSKGQDGNELRGILTETLEKYGLSAYDLDETKAGILKSIIQVSLGDEDTRRVIEGYIAENLETLKASTEVTGTAVTSWKEAVASVLGGQKRDEILAALAGTDRELSPEEAERLRNMIQYQDERNVAEVIENYFSQN